MSSVLAAGVPAESVLTRAVVACRSQFAAVGLFSMVVNLLQLTTSIYMMQVYDRVLATRNTDTLLFLTLITFGALALLGMLEGTRGMIMQRTATWIEQSAAPESFARGIESQLRGRPYRMEALRDLAVCRGFVSSPAMLSIYDVPWVPIYLGVIFFLHPMLGWVSVAGAALLFTLTLINEAATSSLLRKASTAAALAHRNSESVVRNAEVIDSMGMMPAVQHRWQEAAWKALPDQQRAADRAGVVLSLTKFIRLGVQVAILGAGALLVLNNEMTSGAMIAGSIIMGRALAPVEQLIGGWKHLVGARTSYRRLKAFLALPRLRPAGIPLPEPEGRLSVERVSYGFPGQAVPVIKGVSFALEPGESLAIIGPSAAGKTTLIRLLCGTYEPMAGTVRLDGANVFQWQRSDFGRHIGYLPQDVELFDGTVFDNIARLQTATPEDVYAAARLAGCHEAILRLPKGYETGIGEGGTHLSGGQRQMIGLARALFGNPKLLVLDEPNSNLDGDSEAFLVETLHKMKERGTTVVVVSHRPSMVQGVDKVLLLRDGAVELFGPRAEVMRRFSGPRPAAVASGDTHGQIEDRRAAR